MWVCFYDCATFGFINPNYLFYVVDTSINDPNGSLTVDDSIQNAFDILYNSLNLKASIRNYNWYSFFNETHGMDKDSAIMGRIIPANTSMLLSYAERMGFVFPKGYNAKTNIPSVAQFLFAPFVYILVPEAEKTTKSIKTNPLIGSSRNAGGMKCSGRCGNFSPFSEANQPDGSFICYSCR